MAITLIEFEGVAAFTRRRIEMGLTVRALAKKSGVSPRVIARLEEEYRCQPGSMKTLCTFMGLDMAFFMPEDLRVDGYEDALKKEEESDGVDTR